MKINEILHKSQIVNRRVVVFPGRFQPMMPHHVQVFRSLEAQFPDHEVYFATSNKTNDQDSPFDFEDKRMIASELYGIDPSRVLLAPEPYRHYTYHEHFDGDTTELTLVVGGKDGDRLIGKNVNDQGLVVKKNGEPSHIQPSHTRELGSKPFNERMYVHVADTVADATGGAAGASAFRERFRASDDPASVFDQTFGSSNAQVLQLMTDRLRGTPVMEDRADIDRPPMVGDVVHLESTQYPLGSNQSGGFTEPTTISGLMKLNGFVATDDPLVWRFTMWENRPGDQLHPGLWRKLMGELADQGGVRIKHIERGS